MWKPTKLAQRRRLLNGLTWPEVQVLFEYDYPWDGNYAKWARGIMRVPSWFGQFRNISPSTDNVVMFDHRPGLGLSETTVQRYYARFLDKNFFILDPELESLDVRPSWEFRFRKGVDLYKGPPGLGITAWVVPEIGEHFLVRKAKEPPVHMSLVGDLFTKSGSAEFYSQAVPDVDNGFVWTVLGDPKRFFVSLGDVDGR